MEIQVHTENGRVPVTVMHIHGNIDSSTYQAFEAKAEELIENGTRNILVDLSHSVFISSAGFRALHHIFNKLRAVHPDVDLTDDDMKKGVSSGTFKSPHLKLLKLSRETRTAFEMSGFDMYIEAFNDIETAIASF